MGHSIYWHSICSVCIDAFQLTAISKLTYQKVKTTEKLRGGITLTGARMNFIIHLSAQVFAYEAVPDLRNAWLGICLPFIVEKVF